MNTQLLQFKTEKMLDDIDLELTRARTKFPNANFAFVALVEEVGELAQALLKLTAARQKYSRHNDINPDLNAMTSKMVDEAIQVAVMAIRVGTEIDESFLTTYVEPN